MAFGSRRVLERQTRQKGLKRCKGRPPSIYFSLPPLLKTRDTLPANVFNMPIRLQSCFSFVAKLKILKVEQQETKMQRHIHTHRIKVRRRDKSSLKSVKTGRLHNISHALCI